MKKKKRKTNINNTFLHSKSQTAMILKILHILIFLLFSSDLDLEHIIKLIRVFCIILFYKDTIENQFILAKNISDLGICVIKLCQWGHYFFSMKLENNDRYSLLLHSLPLLKNNCQKPKSCRLDEYLEPFKDKLDYVNKDTMCFSASIGQLYRGRLKENKQDVIIKIKHDHIDQEIHKWETFLYKLVNIFQLKINLTDFFHNINLQLDFQNEIKNLKTFYRRYRKNKKVKIPKFFFGNNNIIIMEYVESIPYSKEYKNTLDQSEINYYDLLGKTFYMDSILISDSIHCDLHSGNWGISSDEKQMVIYDFGWVLTKEISDFKRFFLLTHIHSYKAMNFFLRKYDIDYTLDESLRKYVDSIVSDGKFDVLKGFKCVINLFPHDIKIDNFMFLVLSTCVFLSSLVNGALEKDMGIQMKKQVEFIEKYDCFQALGTLLKASYDINESFENRGNLQKLYDKIYETDKCEMIMRFKNDNKTKISA